MKKFTVTLDCEVVDGAYFITSKKTPQGLCAASHNFEDSWREAGRQLRILFKNNHNMEI